MSSIPQASIKSDRLVFIVGMPRSGTSLVEQILSSHPAVFGAGELPYIIRMAGSLQSTLETETGYPEAITHLTQEKVDLLARLYLRQIDGLCPDATRVVDKMPGNFMHLGLIQFMFPAAHVIHCVREPLDTCLSCYFQDFSRSHPYSYDLSHLASFYKDYRKVMQHWRNVLQIPMLTVQYEDLIADQQTTSKRIVDYCGLEWNEKCLDFHESQRYVATASYDQVRRPIYTTSVSRWKNYAGFLASLVEALN